MTEAGARGIDAEATSGGTRIVLSGISKRVARRMEEAWKAPAFHVAALLDADELDLERAAHASATLTDVLLLRCARGLTQHPELNAHYDAAETAVVRFADVNLGIAVATPKGLMVPVLHAAQTCALAEIAERRRDLVNRARLGQVTIDDLEGGTFTISNLGMFGITRFDAILNPPQVAIMAVGAARSQPELRDGGLGERRSIEVTLTCDHRAVDGVTAAAFLQQLGQSVDA
jgi:pyruvate dehydrogenase E2 component (dihydrolipoamide acetyltransferase)